MKEIIKKLTEIKKKSEDYEVQQMISELIKEIKGTK